MTTLRWVDAFSLDMPALDDAHRLLFGHVQDAILALQQEHWKDAAGSVAALSEEARRHFLDEDLLMREIDYPGYYNHGEHHRRLLLGLGRLQMAFALRPPEFTAAIYDLRSWFALHLLNDDQPLSAYISRQHH